MKLQLPSVEEIIPQGYTLEDMYKHIELCGRVAYKSEDKITDNSAEKFVKMLMKNEHRSVLEHGTVYLTIPRDELDADTLYKEIKLANNAYTQAKFSKDKKLDYITTNYRVIVENKMESLLKYMTPPVEGKHYIRRTFKFICSRAIANEFVRHRTLSMTQESTRYVNYSKDKFDNQITIIIPSWFEHRYEGMLHILDWRCRIDHPRTCKSEEDKIILYNHREEALIFASKNSEYNYLKLIREGAKPQEARDVLPLATKTELIMTGFCNVDNNGWKHFLSLRSPEAGAKGVHPDAAYLADKVYVKLNNYDVSSK